jgi:hypothetical protein
MLLAFILLASTQAWLIGVVFLVAGAAYYAVRKRLRQPDEKKTI